MGEVTESPALRWQRRQVPVETSTGIAAVKVVHVLQAHCKSYNVGDDGYAWVWLDVPTVDEEGNPVND